MTDQDRIEILRNCLRDCAGLFSTIRDDYTDPRSECREGVRMIALAMAATSGPDAKDCPVCGHDHTPVQPL